MIVLGATSCGRLPFLPSMQSGEPPAVLQTGTNVSPQLLSATQTPNETATPSLAVTNANTLAAAQFTATAALPCDAATAGRPIDVTIPDDTVIPAGASFTKTWRLVNSGSCTWTREYAVVWFSGDQMGPALFQPLPHEVQSGQSVDISVDLRAPEEIGVRQSYWKLRNADSKYFGIGPAGDAPFWVRIIVEETPSAEPTASLAPTSTSVALLQGSLDLVVGEGVDLDAGVKITAGQGDLDLGINGDQILLQPTSGALISLSGFANPSQADCRQVAQNPDPLTLTNEMVGAYYCYTTDQGLPGVARLMAVNLDSIRLDFVTWAIP